jgi:hypothetical protein
MLDFLIEKKPLAPYTFSTRNLCQNRDQIKKTKPRIFPDVLGLERHYLPALQGG